jgi:hypothetical protein
MTGIDPATHLAALIRAQVSSLRRPQTGKQPTLRRQERGQQASPDLATVVAVRIRSIASDDPQRESKAIRMFLETVLLSEMGQHLVGDPSFSAMVDHVLGELESDPALARACFEAGSVLLRSADR